MPSARRRPDLVAWGLVALLAWSLAARVWLATPELDAGRFWDERYGLENVEAHLRHGAWLPVNAYHPALSYLPQAAVLGAAHLVAEATGDPDLAVLRPAAGFTPLGYLLARLVQAVFGTLSIWWLFRIGRRLFDPPTALLAAALMAVVPWHLRQSAIFKPDILMLWLLLVALEWSLAAWERPRAGRFARAGLGVGLAAAAKYNGAVAALPLAIGWLAGPGRRRALGGIVLAATVAVAVFFALDPHLLLRPELLVADFGETLRHYADEAAQAAASRGEVALHAVRSLLLDAFHGPAVGVLAVAGLAWLAWAAARAEPERRRRLAMIAGFPPAYVALYVAATGNPSEHNWLPIVPFTSLTAAALATAAGRAVAGLVGGRWLRRGLATVATGGVLLLAGDASLYVYRRVVPSTWELAEREVLHRLGADSRHRLVWQEGLDRYRIGISAERRRKPVLVAPRVARRHEIDPGTADVRLERVGRGRLPAAAGARILRLAPRPFAAHGPELRLTFHPWRLAGPPRGLAVTADGDFPVPPPAPGEEGAWLTLEVLLRAPEVPIAGLAAEWNGRRLPLFWGGTRSGRRQRWSTPRVPAAAGPTELRVLGEPQPEVLRVDAVRWLPPSPPGG